MKYGGSTVLTGVCHSLCPQGGGLPPGLAPRGSAFRGVLAPRPDSLLPGQTYHPQHATSLWPDTHPPWPDTPPTRHKHTLDMPRYGQSVVGTHPTGMHSYLKLVLHLFGGNFFHAIHKIILAIWDSTHIRTDSTLENSKSYNFEIL